MIKTSYNKAAGELKPEAYPQGYVEDFDEPRTPLDDVFIIRGVFRRALGRRRVAHRRLR